MNETEVQAQEFLRRKEWFRAVELFDELLRSNNNKGITKERVVSYLLGRSECCLELGLHEAVVSDCRKVIKLLADSDLTNNNGARARRRLVHALFSLRRFAEAEAAAREWLTSCGGATNQLEAVKMLERVKIVLQMANGQKQNKIATDELGVDCKMEQWTSINTLEGSRILRKHPVELIEDGNVLPKDSVETTVCNLNFSHVITDTEIDFTCSKETAGATSPDIYHSNGNEGNLPSVSNVVQVKKFVCSYCSTSYESQLDLRAHCQTVSHQTVIMSDEGRDWKWRPPPRGLTADAYSLCESWVDGNGVCRYGAQCVEAHGPEELAEWRERFEYRKMKLQRACEKELFGKSYTEQLLERWVQAPSPEKVMKESLDDVEESCNNDLITSVSCKVSEREWIFSLRSDRFLQAVALLQDAHRNHFFLKFISYGDPSRNLKFEWSPTNDQEWNAPPASFLEQIMASEGKPVNLEHQVKVAFSTDIYGTFRQSVVFDFGTEPVLVRHLCVDVVPVTDIDKMKEMQKELCLSASERWDIRNSVIIPFVSAAVQSSATNDSEREKELLNAYPNPRSDNFSLTQSTVTERKLTRNNYRDRMHELLCVEEMARYEQVSRYNITAKLHLVNCYLLAPSGMATSTAKYAHAGELFALMNLGKDISEDTSAGRLILNNCATVLFIPAKGRSITAPSGKSSTTVHSHTEIENDSSSKPDITVYEALIEDKGKNMIYLRISEAAVLALGLKNDTDVYAEVQFQLNRIPYCEWHYAIDKIGDFRVIFPDTFLEPSIPWTPQRQWSEISDSRLNLKQKEAVVAITTPVSCPLPPILIIGPFGTGKTYTLAQAIKQLLLQENTHVLVCTHSNSAADLYIKDYLHPYVEAGNTHARPLRIYYHKRWVATVNHVVQKYCLIEVVGGVKSFRVPTLEDIMKHRVIVVTLSISMYLSALGLPKGHFSHILLDEAAQAMECEAIMPLALANEKTRIVLAGDHMQLSPELFSQFAKERNLHVSLLERLYDHYPPSFPCKILLCENYRAHEAIIQFTSELFYDQKLISSGKQPRHEKFYPLTFFTTRGEDVQDQNSTAFYNNAEVYEVVERVCELRKNWPLTWGKIDDQSIGIMTPYADQVFRIRSELRKRRMGGISVERVLNVQGKQFRAIFLSTVRTRRTCHSGTKSVGTGDDMDYGFLSNSKLLNTAITRAQSLVAVVGDPVALCSIGRCRKVWERFIEICNENKSLFGITWSHLRSQLDGVELKKTYVLNPLAPEFVPRQFQGESYIRFQPTVLGPYSVPPLRFPSTSQPPLPPYMPPNIYPYPAILYYPSHPPHPPNPAPPISNPNFFPLRNPPVVFPGTSPAVATVHQWYPLMSPSGIPTERNAPINWSLNVPQTAPPSKKLDGRIEELPFSSYIKVPVPTGSSNIKAAEVLHPPPTSETFIQNGILPPNFAIQQPSPVFKNIILENHMPRLNADKQEYLQFLHLDKQLAQTHQDLSHFLPQNVSILEMLESRSRQQEWYNHLMETAGFQVADKFMELINFHKQAVKHLAPSSPSYPDNMNSSADMVRILEELIVDKCNVSNRMPTQPALQANMMLNNGHTSLLFGSSDKFCKYNTSNNIPDNKTVGCLEVHLPVGNHQEAPSHPPISQDFPQQREVQDVTEILWPGRQHSQSIPLYRRQPAKPVVDTPLSPVRSLLDNVVDRSSSGSSGAFAGYARAAINYGLQAGDSLFQNNQIPHQQQGIQEQIPYTQSSMSPTTQLLNSTESSFVRNSNFAERNGDNLNSSDRQSCETTYASVLRAQPQKSTSQSLQNQEIDKSNLGDPFAVLRALGSKNSRSSSGLYHYFS